MKLQIRTILMRAAMLLVSLYSVSVTAEGKPVDETLPASAGGHVEISVVRGELEVRGWDRSEIYVTGILDEQMTEFVFDVDAENATIAVRVPRSTDNWCCDDGSNLKVYVPMGSQVNIASVSTDVRVLDLAGGLDVGAVSGDVDIKNVQERVMVALVSGDIDIQDARGRIRLKSVSGDVHASNIDGPMDMHSVSGDLTLRGASGDVEVKTVSGDIDVQDLGFRELRGSSVSGDIDIEGEVRTGGIIECDTISGDIRVKFAGVVSARFDLDTRSGSIRNRLNDEQPTESKYANRENLRMVVGAGETEVILQSRSGNIVISQ